jgi:hypothetical protein
MTDVQPQDQGAQVSTAAIAEEGVVPALIAGAVAALLGGAIWAVIVLVAHLEVGYVAWGVGALVGFAMSRATPARGQALGVLAALLAAAGLAAGKTLIITVGTKPALVEEIQADQEWMSQIALQNMRETDGFPTEIQQQLDGLSFTDTLPDALWEEMLAAGSEHAAQMSAAERERVAIEYADLLVGAVGFVELFRAQLSPWDLLWFGLAIVTAWKLMVTGAGRPEEIEVP